MGQSEFTPNQVSDFTPIIVFGLMDLFWETFSTCCITGTGTGIISSFYEGLMSFY